MLLALAGDAAPNVALGKAAAERKKCRDAWAAWWKKAGDKADLTKLADGLTLGRTLIVERDATKPAEGRVMEVGRDGAVRWQITGLRLATDVQPLPGGRVLVCEYSAHRVTERSTKTGEVLWEKSLPAGTAGMVLGAQRLANGHTFVVTRGGLLEFDRDGKEVWNYRAPGGPVYAARKSRSGEVALITSAGTCVRLDADGKEIATFPAARIAVYSGIDLLPNGNVLVPVMTQGKVCEYDAKGKVVWEAAVPMPTAAVRLPNGHTLASSGTGRRVVEFDRDGKEVWKCETEGRPYRAYRR